MSREAGGWALRGTVVRQFKEGSGTIAYVVRTDGGWRTRRVWIEQLLDGAHGEVEIEVSRGAWFVGREERRELHGCVDVDLEATPATNILPLKRIGMKVGSKVDVKVAWMRFPSLKVLPLRQSYERLGKARYVYRSGPGFEAELDVDGFGLVRRYGQYWTAV